MSAAQLPVTPNLAAVAARRQSLRSSMGGLENALAAPAAPVASRAAIWIPKVSAALAQVRDCMDTHIAATEGPTGFHHEMITAAPRLGHAVQLSVREHGFIVELLAELTETLNRPPDDDTVGEVRAKGTRVLALLARHRQRGADMVFEAYQTDLGGGD